MSLKVRLSAGLAAVLTVTSLSVGVSQAAGPTGPARVNLGKTSLGEVLIGDRGLTLYMFTRDSNGQSVCYDQCAVAWPALLTNGAPVAGAGVKQELLGTTTRKDGTTQVTYNGMPLYYWFKDTAPNQWNGQSVGKVWWVVTPNGRFVTKPLPHYASLAAGKTPYGDILVGNDGKAVYMFTKDTDGQSVCYDQCATIWPPVLSDVQVFTGAGIDPKLIGSVARKDGTKQVTFNGMPLYYYWEDAAPGDLKGQNFNSVWFVLRPSGEVLRPG